jgi:hypothetical protein
MRTLALGIVYASLLFGQLESNTVTVTASRSIYVKPDQAQFAISSAADISSGLQAAGIPGAQLIRGAAGLGWVYTLGVPLNGISDAIARLTAAQKKLNFSFSIQGMQASPQLLASQQCSNADLIADARAQAQKLATVAGLSLGPIAALSDAGSGDFVATSAVLAVARLGSFSFFNTTGYASLLLGSTTTFQPFFSTSVPALNCSLTVKFGLVRF